MSFKERDTRAISGVTDDATEVLATSAPSQASEHATGEDPTVVLTTPYMGNRSFTAHDPDATVALSVSSPQAPGEAPTVPLSSFDSDATVVLPATRSAHQGPSTATLPVHGEGFKAKLYEGKVQGVSVAKNGLATAKAKAKQTAERVKQERASRAAHKTPHNLPPQQVPRTQYAPLTAQRQPRPLYIPNQPVAFQPYRPASAPYQQGQQVAPHMMQATSQPAVAHSGESSPSGRLQMLTPSHIRQTRPSLWTLIQHFFAAGTLFFLMVATFVFFVGTPVGQELDEISFQEFAYQFMTYTDQTSSLLDFIPASAGIIAAIGILFVLVWKHRFLPALVGLGMALGANVSSQVLKNFLVVKPDLGIQEAVVNSAPSGHTTFAAAAGLALFLASPKRFRPTVALLSMFFTVAAGYSTVINGWHRPADVVTSILLTGLWAVLGLVILRFMRSEELDMSNTQRSGLILVPLLSISGFFVGFCAVALYWMTYTNPIPGSAFMAALCMIASVAAFTTSIQVALLRPQNKQRSAYKRVWAY